MTKSALLRLPVKEYLIFIKNGRETDHQSQAHNTFATEDQISN